MSLENGSGNGTSLSIYDRVIDPLQFMVQAGDVFWKSGAAGVKSQAEGQLVALACMTERMNPFELARRFHIMDGKLTMRSDAMLAEFRGRGGKHVWIKDGSDGKEARCRFSYDGQDQEVGFTIAEAEKMGLIRSGSAWEKDPGAMLRARTISRAIRMIAPEVVAGCYTPEEISDSRDEPHATVTNAVVESRRQELVQESSHTDDQPSGIGTYRPPAEPRFAIKEEVEDGKQETTTADATPAATEKGTSTDGQLMEIESLLTRAGTTRDALEARLAKSDPTFTRIDDLSSERADQLIDNLQSKLAKIEAGGT